jgi:hypothetical protein
MTFPTHRNTSQFVSDGPRRVVRIVRCLCTVLVLQLSIGFAAAQQNVVKPDQQVQKPEGGLPETPKMLQAREEYAVFTLKNRQDAFAWQSVSTKVIFWVVIIVVLAGLYLSWMQFNFAHNAPNEGD